MTEDIEVSKLGKLSLHKNIDNIEIETAERKKMDMSDDKESDGWDQISKNDGEIVTDDIEVLKMEKLGSKENDDNIEEKHNERNRMDTSDGKESDESYQIYKNDEERVTNDI